MKESSFSGRSIFGLIFWVALHCMDANATTPILYCHTNTSVNAGPEFYGKLIQRHPEEFELVELTIITNTQKKFVIPRSAIEDSAIRVEERLGTDWQKIPRFQVRVKEEGVEHEFSFSKFTNTSTDGGALRFKDLHRIYLCSLAQRRYPSR